MLFLVSKLLHEADIRADKPLVLILQLLLQLRNALNQLLLAPSTIIHLLLHFHRIMHGFGACCFGVLFWPSPAVAARHMEVDFGNPNCFKFLEGFGGEWSHALSWIEAEYIETEGESSEVDPDFFICRCLSPREITGV